MRLLAPFLLTAVSVAGPVPLVNPSLEINNGVSSTPLSDPAIPGWEGTATLSEGDIDYGNGRWKILFDDQTEARQTTSHRISAGESLSIRFDAALAPDTSVIPEGAIVGGSLLNGNFEGGNSNDASRTFAATPSWFNLTGNQDEQATAFINVPGETRFATLTDGGNRLFALQTGYTLTENQKLDLQFRWRDGANWNDTADRVRVTLFTTSDDTPAGVRNEIGSVSTENPSSNGAFETFSASFPPVPAGADGKTLFLLVEGVDGDGNPNGEAALDDFVLSLFNPLLIGPGLRNGDFTEDPSLADFRSFQQTPHWTNLSGNQGAQATRTNILYNGTRTTVLNQTAAPAIFGNETGYTLAAGDVPTVSFVWRDASGWTDTADRVSTFIYTTANDQILGPRTILQTILAPFSTRNSTWENFTTDFDPIPASAAGRRLFVAFQAFNGDGATGFGRVADFRLSVNDNDPALPPDPPEGQSGGLIAEAIVEDNGGTVVVASRRFTLKQGRTPDWGHYHLAIQAGTLDDHAGKEIGLRFRGPQDGDSLIRYVDNVRLDFYPADPPDGSFASNWNNAPTRVWPGPGYWGNRLQDWEVRNGRVNCIFRGKPRRVLHRVGTSIRGNGGDFTLSVRTGLASGSHGSGARTGFLIGAGPNLDWRASLLVHDGLGRDFGTFLGINQNGAALIEDLSAGGMDQVAIGVTPPQGFRSDTRLVLSATYDQVAGSYDLTISAFDSAGTLRSSASLAVSSNRVLGSFGLVSHRSNNGSAYWFDDFAGSGSALRPEPSRNLAFIGAMHSLNWGELRMSAQLPPVNLDRTREVTLEIEENGSWSRIATAPIDRGSLSSYNAAFVIPDWDDERDTPYRLGVEIDGETYHWGGTVKRDPVEENTIVVANTSCQRVSDVSIEADTMDWSPVKMWHPHLLAYRHLTKHRPHVLLALGDQIYEGQPTGKDTSSNINRHHDYLYKWYLWMLQARELARDIPTISIPDDHDIYQGNLWGEGGKSTTDQRTGGYEQPADWVRLVERTQASHLPAPDPYNPVQPAPPVEQGISVYFTGMSYGEVGFAVLEDRKFKTGPENAPADPAQQILLGQRQKDFLRAWSTDWKGQRIKCAVSQSPFGMLHTHASAGYSYFLNDRDSHGWPVHRRREVWDLLRLSRSFQLAGDQHLSTLVHHGVNSPADAGYSFASPAISNFFPRVWDPVHNAGGRTETISPYKGDFFLDGKGTLPSGQPNLSSDIPGHVRIVGAANPLEYYNRTRNIDPANLHDRGAGYGIIRIDKTTREITFESWPLHADPEFPSTGGQFPDWPVTINQTDNDGRTPAGFLPLIDTLSEKTPVVSVYDESTNDLVYSMRFPGSLVRLPVYNLSRTYRVEISYGDDPVSEVRTGQRAVDLPSFAIRSFSALRPSIITGGSTVLQWNVAGAASLTIDKGLGDVTSHTIHGIGHLQVSPTSDTTYTLTLNGSETATATVLVFPTEASWRFRNFTAAELADPAVSGKEADPDGDGFTNDQEFQFQTDPRDANSHPRLVSDVVKGNGLTTFNFTSPFPLRSEQCTLRLEASSDLEVWSPLPSNSYREVERSSAGQGTTRISIRYIDPMEEGVLNFYRIRWTFASSR